MVNHPPLCFPVPSRPQPYLLRYSSRPSETCNYSLNHFFFFDAGGCFYLVGEAGEQWEEGLEWDSAGRGERWYWKSQTQAGHPTPEEG